MLRAAKLSTSVHTIFVLALFVRLGYLIFLWRSQPPHVVPFSYGGETGHIAASIALGHGFSSPLGAPSGPTAWITPVFPYLLAAVFKLLGVYSVGSYYAIRLIDVVFSAATVYPIFFLAKKIFAAPAAATAAWMWSVLPAAIYFPVVWVWDMSLSALILATAVWFTYVIAELNDSAGWLLLGCLWGVAVLVNAALISLAVLCIVFAVYLFSKHSAHWPRKALLAALAWVLTLSPWIIRNELVFRGKVALRSNFGLELWLGNNPEVPDTWTWWLHPTGSPQEHAEFMRLGEIAYMQRKERQAWGFMKTHPADVARFQFHRFLQTWTGETDSFADIWATGSWRLRAEIVWNYSLTLLMLTGLLLAYRRAPLTTIPLLCAIVLFPIPYYICHTDPRYRHPIDPVIVILASLSIVQLATKAAAIRETRGGTLPAS